MHLWEEILPAALMQTSAAFAVLGNVVGYKAFFQPSMALYNCFWNSSPFQIGFPERHWRAKGWGWGEEMHALLRRKALIVSTKHVAVFNLSLSFFFAALMAIFQLLLMICKLLRDCRFELETRPCKNNQNARPSHIRPPCPACKEIPSTFHH